MGNRRAASCTNSDLMVTSKLFGFHLSSSDLQFTTEDNVRYWQFLKPGNVKGNSNTTDIFNLRDPGSDRYLTVMDKNTVDLKKPAPGGSDGYYDQQWKVISAGCASGGNYYYIQSVGDKAGKNVYLESGFFYPHMTDKKHDLSKFYITSKTGQLLCSVATGTWQCDKQCKTGLLVPWHKFGIPETNATKQTEAEAADTCNKHCKTCNGNDKNCKACSGTLDKYKDFTDTKQGKSSQTTSYFRQCDCNSAYKAVTLSLMPVLFLLLNFKLQN
jgi:hypothetical protein